MTRFIHLTDLHVSHPDAEDPANITNSDASLQQAIAAINAMDPEPDFVVASGDLVNLGDVASYAMLHGLLAPLRAPLLLALGNHDSREGFYQSLGQPVSQEPYCHDAVFGDLHVITLDTSRAGHVGGTIDAAQFDWFADALLRHPPHPKLIVMHHPPRIDPDSLIWASIDDAATSRLAQMLAGQNVAGILAGHIHLNRVSQWHGIPLIINNGLYSAMDPLETHDLRSVVAQGFCLCEWRASGLSACFVPLTPQPRELGVIDRARLLSFT